MGHFLLTSVAFLIALLSIYNDLAQNGCLATEGKCLHWSINSKIVLRGVQIAHSAFLVNITARKSPKIVDQAERLNHPEGTNGTLMCSIGSGELDGLRYEWLKDDRPIASSTRYRISVAAENFNSILRVIDLKQDDSGTYSCVARNAFGQDKISIKLSVKGKFL